MRYTTTKLTDLQKELKQIVRDVEAGRVTHAEAADKIIHIKGEMDLVIQHLRNASNPKMKVG